MTNLTANPATAMVPLPGGHFRMGSADFYPEESPVRTVDVAPFELDPAPVTNRQFAEFVATTGYVTLAELPPDPADYPGILPSMLAAGSIVFIAPPVGSSRVSPESWWHFVRGASWREPYGPDGGISAIDDHPVVHVAYQDAVAYAEWTGKRLPSAAEHEFAARGGLDGAAYAWGEELAPDGVELANIWLEGFPFHKVRRPGAPYTTAVKSYPANPYGLYDLIGNVWEWTTTDADGPPGNNGCCGTDPRSLSPSHRKVLKGGSHLCSPDYCRRYRPASIWPQPVDTSTSHVGFRCARSIPGG